MTKRVKILILSLKVPSPMTLSGPKSSRVCLLNSSLSIYIKHFVCQSVTFCLSHGDKEFVCPPRKKHFLHLYKGGGDKEILMGGGDIKQQVFNKKFGLQRH